MRCRSCDIKGSVRQWPVLVLLLFAAGAQGAAGAAAKDLPSPVLAVHYVNDWQAQLTPWSRPDRDRPIGGAARLAHLLDQRRELARSAGLYSLFLVVGDTLQGSRLATLFESEPMIAVLGAMKPDALSLGLRDLGYGNEDLRRRLKETGVTVLASNVEGLSSAQPSVIVTRGEIRIALIGLLPPWPNDRGSGDGVVEIEDPVATASAAVSELKEASDLVLLLSSCGREIDEDLARIPGVDLVIGGRDQLLLDPPLNVDPAARGAPVVQAFRSGAYLGEAIFLRSGTGVTLGANSYLPVVATLEEEPAVADLIARYQRRVPYMLEQSVAVAAATHVSEEASIRTRETPLGDLVADAIREGTSAEVALINAGSIRGSLERGPVSNRDLLEILPFPNQILLVELPGATLRRVLERSLEHGLKTSGGFLQVSGLRLVAEGPKLLELSVEGEPVGSDRTYLTAITDFLYLGGDGYVEFAMADQEPVATGRLVHEALLAYLRQLGLSERTLDMPDARIRFADDTRQGGPD